MMLDIDGVLTHHDATPIDEGGSDNQGGTANQGGDDLEG